ncbi:LysR substrate-binding domain-containing protein, partial [Ramlibacter sp.]|uniref:LysR substrate-binding domain-containing protein n=1 Tax=Ramlibacter sp. TaxID=1917967 RepID=UPI0017E5D8C1
ALRRDVGAAQRPAAGCAVLLVNSSVNVRPLQGVVGDVLARHPGARLSVRESASEATVHALHTGAAGVGIVTDAAATDGLVAEELGADPLVLVAARGHALAARGALRFSDALAHDWVGWREDGALHTHLVMQAVRAGGALNTVVSVPTAEGVLDLVARGFGISVLPRALLAGCASASQLAILELEEPWARRKLLVCRRADTTSPLALALFAALQRQWPALDPICAAPAPAPRPPR